MVSLHLSVPERIRKVWSMDSQNIQSILIGIDFLLVELKSETRGLFVSEGQKDSGVDGGEIM